VTFQGPMAQADGREAYLEAIGGFAPLVTDIDVIAVVGDEQQAMMLYDMTTGPFGTLRAANHFQIRDGRIIADKLVFDTHKVREAQAA